MTELLEIFIKPLAHHGLDYLVTGSVAAMAYGEPRLTNDIDLILDIRGTDVAPLVAAFPAADFYLPPPEVIHCERIRPQRGHFNIIHQQTMLKADVYLAGSDPLHRWAFEHARHLEIDGIPVNFAPPEYVIIRKLEFFREGGSEKHLRDIAAMLAESGAELDHEVLNRQIPERGLDAAWQRANEIDFGC
ncbi:MAG: hypothetical protein K9N23_20995 [Akkermansiaceae bacterium]|nr:hypothetical protein [Akkermansiaceae bacterium]MCF7734174.1 hypothetical protein [Akkermansiaceae bacterium]